MGWRYPQANHALTVSYCNRNASICDMLKSHSGTLHDLGNSLAFYLSHHMLALYKILVSCYIATLIQTWVLGPKARFLPWPWHTGIIVVNMINCYSYHVFRLLFIQYFRYVDIVLKILLMATITFHP